MDGSPKHHSPVTVGPYDTDLFNFPCGRKLEYQKETHDFRQSVVLYSRSYSELFLSESRKRACSWFLTRAADNVCTHLLYIRPDSLASGLGGHVTKNVSFA